MQRKSFQAAMVFMLAATGGVQGQPLTASQPIVGATRGLTVEMPRAEQNVANKIHRNAAGKPCIQISASSRDETINPKIKEHIISATNSCNQRIKMKVCYYRTQNCVPLEIAAYDRKETVLGIFPSLTQFRYEYSEQF
ncbi:hypothetical protein C2U70_27185 [Bradyrhizobium guangdongense]|uniref:hypothetical protein n=1 Tax=Bradyrhizobium guangdongense TaxID=1325090 RepID=UPI0011282B8E|nr:hypothetical protein [Bradyrhizobium guangdongense]TPQ30228.1 hypothetical protein C2U70_27185 [Bradyrhizobium guangdongense]